MQPIQPFFNLKFKNSWVSNIYVSIVLTMNMNRWVFPDKDILQGGQLKPEHVWFVSNMLGVFAL